MTIEERLHGLIFNGVQEFGGKAPALGIFTDPVTQSSFSVQLDHPIGPALDELRRIWGEEGTMSLPDHEIEEPSDSEFCEEHNRYRPCYRCKVTAAEDRADHQRDERAS